MSTRINYALVGLFILVLGTALIAVLLWLSAGGPGRAFDNYLVYMEESVSGLSRDSTVKYYGVDVGRVHGISLGPGKERRVKLVLQIDRGTPIRQDTVATLEAQGLTGLTYLNLTGGHEDSPLLGKTQGEDFPVIRSEPSIWGRLDRSLGDLVDSLIEVSHRLKLLLSDENQRLITAILARVSELSTVVSGRAATLAAAIDDAAGTMKHLRETGEALPAVVSQVQATASALEDMAGELEAAGGTVRHAVSAAGEDVHRLASDALPEIVVLVRELQEAAGNLRRFSEQLERDPGVLLRGAAAGPPGPGE